MSKEINGLKTKKMLACGSKLFCVQVDSKKKTVLSFKDYYSTSKQNIYKLKRGGSRLVGN